MPHAAGLVEPLELLHLAPLAQLTHMLEHKRMVAFLRARQESQVVALAEQRFDGERFPVICIDGVQYAGETMICALGITADGQKRLLGVRQGARENAAVCTALLEDLCGRGLDTSSPTLLVLDGAKALHANVTRNHCCPNMASLMREVRAYLRKRNRENREINHPLRTAA